MSQSSRLEDHWGQISRSISCMVFMVMHIPLMGWVELSVMPFSHLILIELVKFIWMHKRNGFSDSQVILNIHASCYFQHLLPYFFLIIPCIYILLWKYYYPTLLSFFLISNFKTSNPVFHNHQEIVFAVLVNYNWNFIIKLFKFLRFYCFML